LASESGSSRIVDGLWRAPGVARATPARLSVDAMGMASVGAAQTGEALSSEAFSQLSVTDRVGSIPRRVDFADGSSFETRDNDGIDQLLRPYRGPRSGWVHELEKFRPRLIIFVALVLAFSVAIYRFAVPALVEVAVLSTPPVVPQLMSRSVLASLDGTVFEPTGLSVDKQKALTTDFQKLAALTPRGLAALTAPDHPAYTLYFRKGGPIGPNAFALPDGTVVLTDELVDLVQNDEMVLGVLAHEIGHVEHQHSLRQLYRAAGASALIMLIGGDIGSGTEDILVQGSALLSLSYSRSAEAEADRHSVELMYKAGHDPHAIGHFLELIRDKLGDKEERDFLSTHPATPERIADTLRYADEIAGKQ
jgi:Zn-dependent protease with chaperone function